MERDFFLRRCIKCGVVGEPFNFSSALVSFQCNQEPIYSNVIERAPASIMFQPLDSQLESRMIYRTGGQVCIKGVMSSRCRFMMRGLNVRPSDAVCCFSAPRNAHDTPGFLHGSHFHASRNGAASQMSLLLNLLKLCGLICSTFASLQQTSGLLTQFVLLHTVAG